MPVMRSRIAVLSWCAAMAALVPSVAFPAGGGDMTFAPKGAGKVLFQHEYHVNLKKRACADCHDSAFRMQGGDAFYKMDMGTLTKGQFCGICHNGAKAFDVKDAKNCSRCHRE
jgi:c(7)-type cytochrome triheme protein